MKQQIRTWCLVGLLFSNVQLLAADQDKPAPEPAELEVVIDVSEVPQHGEWAEKAAKLCKEWYPKLVTTLPSDGYKPPTKVTLQFRKT